VVSLLEEPALCLEWAVLPTCPVEIQLTDRPEALMTRLAMALIVLASSRANPSLPSGGWSGTGVLTSPASTSVESGFIPSPRSRLHLGLSLASAIGCSPDLWTAMFLLTTPFVLIPCFSSDQQAGARVGDSVTADLVLTLFQQGWLSGLPSGLCADFCAAVCWRGSTLGTFGEHALGTVDLLKSCGIPPGSEVSDPLVVFARPTSALLSARGQAGFSCRPVLVPLGSLVALAAASPATWDFLLPLVSRISRTLDVGDMVLRIHAMIAACFRTCRSPPTKVPCFFVPVSGPRKAHLTELATRKLGCRLRCPACLQSGLVCRAMALPSRLRVGTLGLPERRSSGLSL
jgi:hypothetical protein